MMLGSNPPENAASPNQGTLHLDVIPVNEKRTSLSLITREYVIQQLVDEIDRVLGRQTRTVLDFHLSKGFGVSLSDESVIDRPEQVAGALTQLLSGGSEVLFKYLNKQLASIARVDDAAIPPGADTYVALVAEARKRIIEQTVWR